MNRISFPFFILLLFTGCTKTRYLSDEEVNFMPYKAGDLIILINTSSEKVDTILVDKIHRYVPDGPMIYFNEGIDALNKNDRALFRISAGYGKFSEAYLSIKGLHGRHSLKSIENQTPIKFQTQNLTFDDVVVLESSIETSNTNEISRVYWSKSKGIVQYDDFEGIWQLVNLKRSRSN